LAVVIDLFSRKVLGWSMRPDMQRDLVIDALEMAWFKRNPGKEAGLIFHSDRGSQYASDDFSAVLRDHGITPSMSRKGNCWDNACSETLFGSLKVERLHGRRFETIRAAKDETISWLLWYNRTRMHSTLNYVSPVQFEQRLDGCCSEDRRMRCEAIEAGRGNDGLWKSPENDSAVFRPFHRPWKSIEADSHIPTATTTTRMIIFPQNPAR